MKKIALFVALVVVFGGIYTFVYLSNSRNTNANNSQNSISKTCQCEDPEKCKAEGKCDGDCEDENNCSVTTCESVKTQAIQTTPSPYVPPCCKDKVNK